MSKVVVSVQELKFIWVLGVLSGIFVVYVAKLLDRWLS